MERFVKVPGLDDVVIPAEDDVPDVALDLRRAQCIDCMRFVRVNNSEDRFWPWQAEDGSLICDKQSGHWGHRVNNAVAMWLQGDI